MKVQAQTTVTTPAAVLANYWVKLGIKAAMSRELYKYDLDKDGYELGRLFGNWLLEHLISYDQYLSRTDKVQLFLAAFCDISHGLGGALVNDPKYVKELRAKT